MDPGKLCFVKFLLKKEIDIFEKKKFFVQCSKFTFQRKKISIVRKINWIMEFFFVKLFFKEADKKKISRKKFQNNFKEFTLFIN